VNYQKEYKELKNATKRQLVAKYSIMKKKLIEIPEELFEKIEASAKKNVRSVNKEIQFLLASAVGKK
jgi:hypothetical protein